MGIVFNFDDEPEEEVGKRITFGKLNFITDQFRTYASRSPN